MRHNSMDKLDFENPTIEVISLKLEDIMVTSIGDWGMGDEDF